MKHQASSSGTRYSVCVERVLDEGWIRALNVTIQGTQRYYVPSPRTAFMLELADQAELLGLLNRLHNLGLTLLFVERVAESAEGHSSELDSGHT